MAVDREVIYMNTSEKYTRIRGGDTDRQEIEDAIDQVKGKKGLSVNGFLW